MKYWDNVRNTLWSVWVYLHHFPHLLLRSQKVWALLFFLEGGRFTQVSNYFTCWWLQLLNSTPDLRLYFRHGHIPINFPFGCAILGKIPYTKVDVNWTCGPHWIISTTKWMSCSPQQWWMTYLDFKVIFINYRVNYHRYHSIFNH